MKIKINSGSPWDDIVGYSRAVRVDNIVEIAGTTANTENEIIGENDVYKQTVFILQKIEKALIESGANITDVVRTRMFVTDISKWELVAKAHAEIFKDIKPVTTMVEVSKLIDNKLLIEIEATAIIQK